MKHILTDLNFLNVGQMWPPQGERDRLQKYENNKYLFEGKHAEVYAVQFRRIERVIGNFQDVISYAVIANFQKLISIKIADLLLGEAPKITAGEDGSPEQQTIDKIIENSDLINTAFMNAIDVSRYGDGLFYVYRNADTGAGQIDVTQPNMWFPVVNPDNVHKVLYHVLAWTIETDEQRLLDAVLGNQPPKTKYLKVQIHSKGSYEERLYKLDPGSQTQIKALVNSNVVQTGLDDFAVIQVPNLITSDRIYGLDDYTDIDSLISELEIRISQIARILDKHAAPSVQGPASALEKDARTGEWHLKMGNYFPRDSKDDPPVEYIVWDAQLEANFKTIDRLINILYTISEMGSAIFGDMESHITGQVTSGSALIRLMISPLAKVNRIKMRFDPALKKAIKLCSELGGDGIMNLKNIPISIVWEDGLPNDPLEDANIANIRTGNKSTMSQFKAIQTLDGLSDKDTQTELDRINEDEANGNPISGGNFPFNNNNPGENDSPGGDE